ncbi:hypothetical protein NM688_g7370 [Phlebia brevispora]|uniref:Uncharacterized protein n=1 Tax=Phlebia brevispora TaxID=194682 RepID=A0ACC1S5X2_9APHY|nr:hypothetical protein NM688_g7370 [Phlebia brevispora]
MTWHLLHEEVPYVQYAVKGNQYVAALAKRAHNIEQRTEEASRPLLVPGEMGRRSEGKLTDAGRFCMLCRCQCLQEISRHGSRSMVHWKNELARIPAQLCGVECLPTRLTSAAGVDQKWNWGATVTADQNIKQYLQLHDKRLSDDLNAKWNEFCSDGASQEKLKERTILSADAYGTRPLRWAAQIRHPIADNGRGSDRAFRCDSS